MGERLQKYLSAAGIASRRKSEEFITAGRVTINDKVAQLGDKVEAGDVVKLDGKVAEAQDKMVYLMLHKPEGYITSTHDQFNRPDVMALIPKTYPRVYPIGRLDYDTSGMLLLTNDGALTQALTHPSHQAEKVYVAKVKGTPTEKEIEAFSTGLDIEGERTAPASLKVTNPDQNGASSVKITLREGRNRQVRKMCEAIGHPVVFLKRIATGGIYLGELKRGQVRELTSAEVSRLKRYEKS
ncbi:MAG: rRNA pseudouridine synthase [Clostridiales bacterium]|jgi:pseudouridine synthase|nr:rRNA pseudouridine synthase [Clostridiales bacterium]